MQGIFILNFNLHELHASNMGLEFWKELKHNLPL